MTDELDGFVIIGGGVCGCLLARELLIRTDAKVHLFEAGGEQAENAADRLRPARWMHLLGSSDDDSHETEPNEALAGRRIVWPRGKGLGGSGRINAMIWVPPHQRDWQSLMHVGLHESELDAAYERALELIPTEVPRFLSQPSRSFLRVMQSRTDRGHFACYRRINRNGRRWTTQQLLDDLNATHPESASRLRVIRGRVTKLQTRGGTIASLRWSDSNSIFHTNVGSQTKVISCVGSLGTPRLLMQSGIGDTSELSRLGIEPLVDSPGVGKNLHDHLIMPVVHGCHGKSFSAARPTMQDLARWQHGGTGPLASNIAECGGFDHEFEFQWHVTPTDYLRYPSVKAKSAMTLGVSLTRPRSRGQIRLMQQSDAPSRFRLAIDTGYLNDPHDRDRMIHGVRLTRNMAMGLSESGTTLAELVPGPRRKTDEQIAAAIARYAQTLYHPGGTCAIGAVVDERLNLHGLKNLSIVDASVLPHPTIANPTAVLATLTCLAASILSA